MRSVWFFISISLVVPPVRGTTSPDVIAGCSQKLDSSSKSWVEHSAALRLRVENSQERLARLEWTGSRKTEFLSLWNSAPSPDQARPGNRIVKKIKLNGTSVFVKSWVTPLSAQSPDAARQWLTFRLGTAVVIQEYLAEMGWAPPPLGLIWDERRDAVDSAPVLMLHLVMGRAGSVSSLIFSSWIEDQNFAWKLTRRSGFLKKLEEQYSILESALIGLGVVPHDIQAQIDPLTAQLVLIDFDDYQMAPLPVNPQQIREVALKLKRDLLGPY